MIIRKIAAVGIAASLLLGTSACGFMSPTASLEVYAPSDGAQIDLENVKVRNFIYLTNGNGGEALFGSIVNSGLESTTFKIQYTEEASSEKREVAFNLLPGQKLDLGYNGNSALVIDLAGTPGKIANIFVIEGNGTGKEIRVPILDGTLAEYKEIFATLPGAATSTEPSAEPTEPAAEEESNH